MIMPEGYKRTIKKLQEIDALTNFSPEIMSSDFTDAVILMKEMAEVMYITVPDWANMSDKEITQFYSTLKKFKEWK